MKRDRFVHSLRKIALMAGAICLTSYSLPSMAAITAGSCAAGTMSAGPYVVQSLPTTLTNGTVLASRVLTTSFKYNKTGNTADTLITGSWYQQGNYNSTYNTVPVSSTSSAANLLPGVGFRMSNIGSSPGGFTNTTLFNKLNVRTVSTAGNNLTATDYWLQELVVTNAAIYTGGQITSLGSAGVAIAFGNQKAWDDQNLSAGVGRCINYQAFIGASALTPEGGGAAVIPPLPVPKNPTCDLGGTNIAVPLPDVDSSTLKNNGDMSGSKSFSIPLGNCGKDAKPYITFTDSNNKANRSTTLGLSAASTAAGVGIVIEKSGGNLVQFGAQNTSVSGSNVGQFLVGTSSADGSSIPLNLTAKYIRTNAELKAGEVKADAIFTIAYP
ncbi:fimbrial protein [Serratia sp. D1N4]